MTEGPGGLPELIDVEELFADPEFANPRISPDGTRLAYLAPRNGRRQVWVRGIEQEHPDAVCVTDDTRRGISTFHWTEDPRWLVYLQDTDGNEDWHLFRVDLEAPDEPAVDLTPMEPGSRVFGVETLPDRPGTVLTLMNRRPTSLDYFFIELATGETTLHLEQPDPLTTILLDQQARPAFVSRLTQDGSYEFSAVDADGGHRPLLSLGGAEYPVGIQPQLVTPDGTGLLLAFYGDSDDLRLVRVDRESGEQTLVAALEGHDLDTIGAMAPGVMPPMVYTRRRTGEPLAARFVGERTLIEVLDPQFGEVYSELAKLSEGDLASLSSSDDGQRWVATFSHDREPGMAWFYDHATGRSRPLFRSYPDLDPDALAPMEPVTIPARDGLALPSYLTLPVGVEPKGLPLVLVVHGGPWAYDHWGYNPEAQLLANRGYAVLHVNFRGSVGYGRRHTVSAIGELGGAMHDDLIDAATWAVEQGYADPERIGIYGGSYGGYAALVGVTVTPDFFAAAVDYVGISNLANFMRTLPPFTRPYMVNNWYRYVGDPADPEQEADMLRRSPITMTERITTPLLVAQGANDVRVVQAESDNIVASLRERGVPVEYIVAEDEGHGFSNPENQIRFYRAMERHFAEHLGGRRGPDADEHSPDA